LPASPRARPEPHSKTGNRSCENDALCCERRYSASREPDDAVLPLRGNRVAAPETRGRLCHPSTCDLLSRLRAAVPHRITMYRLMSGARTRCATFLLEGALFLSRSFD